MEFQRPGVSLGQLVDHMLQKTYHDLSVLAELLPRKHDMERKLEIVKFATRTRKQFVRLLALVKWANSARCIDQCQEVTTHFEKQSMLLASTADQLHHLAKGTLVAARLPNFALPVAVDVLGTGTYPRLPACIKDKIVPDAPLSPTTVKDTKETLEAIICQRLMANDLPEDLYDFSIGDGRVTFVVKDEFEVALTVISSAFSLPWHLLALKILVKDPERPKDDLVIPQQIDYLHRLAQSRLFMPESPLQEMYTCLHSFCVSLQLEVLHSQARRLMDDNSRQYVAITSYKPASELSFEYWKSVPPAAAAAAATRPPQDQPATERCQLQVCVQNEESDVIMCADSALPCLRVVHTPALPTVDVDSGDCHRWQPRAINPGHLSIEALLHHAVEVRTISRLQQLHTYLRQLPLYRNRLALDTNSQHMLLQLSDDAAAGGLSLMVVVDAHAGTFSAQLLPEDPMKLIDTLGINQLLNKPPALDLLARLDRLRARAVLWRCKQQIQARGWSVYTRLPMAPVSVPALAKLGPDHIFIKLARQHVCYLVIEVVNSKSAIASSLDIRCHLLQTGPVPFGLNPTSGATNSSSSGSDHQSGFLNAMLSPLDATLYVGKDMDDSASLVHGPRRKVPRVLEESGIDTAELRVGEAKIPPSRVLPSVRWIEVLSDLTADLVPFSTLLTQLSSAGFSHAHLHVEQETGISVHIIRFPSVAGNAEGAARLSACLISCQILAPLGRSNTYVAMFQFVNCPLHSLLPSEQCSVRRVTHQIQQLQGQSPTAFLQALWTNMVMAYSSVLEFSAYYEDESCEAFSQCCVVSFNYVRLLLAYGPGFRFMVVIAMGKQIKLEFCMVPENVRVQILAERPAGSVPADCREARATQRNPHTFLTDGFFYRLNSTRSIPLLVQGLHHTLPPLLAVTQVVSLPTLSLGPAGGAPQKPFTIIPRSATTFLLIYRGVYHIEAQVMLKGVIVLRDCGYGFGNKAPRPSHAQSVLHFKDFVLLFLAANHPNRGDGGDGGFGAPGKFVVGTSVSGLFTPVPMTPTADMSAHQGSAAAAMQSSTAPSSHAASGASNTTTTAAASAATAAAAAAAGTNGVMDDMSSVDMDALMRDCLHGAGGTPASITDSPRPPASVGETLAGLEDASAATPGGIMDMFSPSFVDSSPANVAAPSPATIKAITGVKPISVNSPATLPWSLGSVDTGDFSTGAGAGGDNVMDGVTYDSSWNMAAWSLSDAAADASLMLDGSVGAASDPLAVPLAAARGGSAASGSNAAGTVLLPPPLGLPGVPAPPPLAATTAGTAAETSSSAGGGGRGRASAAQAHLTSSVSVSYASTARRPSIAVTVAEPTPSVSTLEERITPPDAVAAVIARQKGTGSFSSWQASAPVLVTHHCWFELLRPRRISSLDAPFAAAAVSAQQKAAGDPHSLSQDSGIASLDPDSKSSNGGGGGAEERPPVFLVCPLEGFLASMHMFQRWHGVVQDAVLGLRKVASQPLSNTVATNSGLQCRIWLDLGWPYMLQTALEPTADSVAKGNPYKAEDLRALEKLFLLEVSRPPYRHNALLSFARLISMGKNVLSDMVQILHMNQRADSSLLWTPELCLVVPPSVRALPPILPGGPAISFKEKLLTYVGFRATSSNGRCSQGDPALRPVVLLFYSDPISGITEYMDFASKDQSRGYVPTPSVVPTYNQQISMAAKHTMAKWKSVGEHSSGQLNLSSAIRYLCANMQVQGQHADPLAAAL